jgi:hypothetical protein
MQPRIYTVTQEERDQQLAEHTALIKIKVWAEHTTKTTARQALMKLGMIDKQVKEVLP